LGGFAILHVHAEHCAKGYPFGKMVNLSTFLSQFYVEGDKFSSQKGGHLFVITVLLGYNYLFYSALCVKINRLSMPSSKKKSTWQH
jgi:hypothetical protein